MLDFVGEIEVKWGQLNESETQKYHFLHVNVSQALALHWKWLLVT